MNGRAIPRAPTSDRALDALKGLALALMLADHAGKAWQPLAAWPWHLAGRPALLLFAVVMAHRLAADPGRAARQLPRLLAWGMVAQPAFVALGHDVLNVLFTHAAGCLVVGLLVAGAAKGPAPPAGAAARARAWAHPHALAALLVAAGAGSVVEYGLAGVLLVPVGVLWRRHVGRGMVPALALLCVAANAPAAPALLLQMAAVLAGSAALAVAVLHRVQGAGGRPLRGFPAVYAGHLSALALLAPAGPADGLAALAAVVVGTEIR